MYSGTYNHIHKGVFMLILKNMFLKILSQFSGEQCPCCSTLLLQDDRGFKLLCHRCGWGLQIEVNEPDEKKLKMALAHNAKMKLSSEDSFRREIKMPNIDLKKDR